MGARYLPDFCPASSLILTSHSFGSQSDDSKSLLDTAFVTLSVVMRSNASFYNHGPLGQGADELLISSVNFEGHTK